MASFAKLRYDDAILRYSAYHSSVAQRNMTPSTRLFQIADQLNALAKQVPAKELAALEDAAKKTGKAWSGSWLGYQSRIYYKNLRPVPPGARFSKEWGFTELHALEGTVGEWTEYDSDGLVAEIKRKSRISDIELLEAAAKNIKEQCEEMQANLLSILTPIASDYSADTFLAGLIEKIAKEKAYSYEDLVASFRPTGQQMSRDMHAAQAGLQVPPHFSVLAEMGAIRMPYSSCNNLSTLARRAASHLENVFKKDADSKRIGTNVFIGHGRSFAWRDLKDFIQDRLNLPWDEFNRVPVAGFTNIARLSQMLDNAAIAFIIMTAEDEQADGKMHARLNVIHEAGLFQGRLGFEKAILLLEDGCEEFSNVQGLGQIRFPTGNVSAIFEEIRRILEREELID